MTRIRSSHPREVLGLSHETIQGIRLGEGGLEGYIGGGLEDQGPLGRRGQQERGAVVTEASVWAMEEFC